MELAITPRQVQEVTVLDLRGRLIFGEEVTLLRESVRLLLAQKRKNILLNLQEAAFVDSSGAGTIVACYTSVRAAGGQLKLANGNRHFREMLELTRLLGLLPLFDSEEEALGSFSR